MSKEKQWSISVGSDQFQIEFKPNQWSGKHSLRVNGKLVEIKRTAFQAFTGIDQPIMLGNKEARFVLIGNKADIAIDGEYVDSKKPYLPLKNPTWWTWLFVAACIAIPVVSFGGAIPAVIAVLGSIYCIRLSVSPGMKMSVRIIASLGVVVLSWAIFGLLLIIIG